MIYCKQLDKEYESKELMFKALKESEDKIIIFKKAQVYKSSTKGQISLDGVNLKIESAEKAGIKTKDGYVYPVINTTNYMDSHDDVHFVGIWKRTKKDQQGKTFYIDGHNMTSIDNVIAWPEDVEIMTKLLKWTDLGRDYTGETEALIFAIPEDKIKKESAKNVIKDRLPVQGSISMRYVKITMGINSKDKAYVLNKQYYDDNIDSIANKDKVEEQGYFFGVEEAKIAGEGSMVLKGSNDVTPIIYHDPSNDTRGNKSEPSNDTQSNKFIINNLIS